MLVFVLSPVVRDYPFPEFGSRRQFRFGRSEARSGCFLPRFDLVGKGTPKRDRKSSSYAVEYERVNPEVGIGSVCLDSSLSFVYTPGSVLESLVDCSGDYPNRSARKG